MKHKTSLQLTVVALLIAGFFYDAPYFIYLILGVIFLYVLSLIFGSGLIQLNYFVNSINKGSAKGVAITFDDGPNSEITPKILDILAKENIKAAFFVIGYQIEAQKELVQRMHNEGHTIGNHSFSHTKKLTTASTELLIEDFSKCSAAIENVIKQKPLFFRPPYGVTNPRYKRAIMALNIKSIGWSIRSLDTKTNDSKKLYKSLTKQISNGSIILFHDTQKVTVEVLPDIIKYCKDNGINIVPLPELINQRAYICTDE